MRRIHWLLRPHRKRCDVSPVLSIVVGRAVVMKNEAREEHAPIAAVLVQSAHKIGHRWWGEDEVLVRLVAIRPRCGVNGHESSGNEDREDEAPTHIRFFRRGGFFLEET